MKKKAKSLSNIYLPVNTAVSQIGIAGAVQLLHTKIVKAGEPWDRRGHMRSAPEFFESLLSDAFLWMKPYAGKSRSTGGSQ